VRGCALLGPLHRGLEPLPRCNEARRKPSLVWLGSGELADLVVEAGLRGRDLGGGTQAFGPVISRGTTH